MKKYFILIIALLFATFTLTAQTKQVAEKLQVTGLKNAELLKTDEKGNVVAGDFPKIDLTPIQTELEKKLNAGAYEGTAQDLATQLNEAVTKVVANEASLQDLTAVLNATKQKLDALAIADVGGLADEITRLEGLIANAGKVKTVNGVAPDAQGNIAIMETDPKFTAWNKDYNSLTNKPTIPDVSRKLDKGNFNGTAADLKTAIEAKVSKVEGKGLSTNDFENKYKELIDDGVSSGGFIRGNMHWLESNQCIKYNLGRYSNVLQASLSIPYYIAGDNIKIDRTDPLRPIISTENINSSNKLDKGGYNGTAQDLKSEINRISNSDLVAYQHLGDAKIGTIRYITDYDHRKHYIAVRTAYSGWKLVELTLSESDVFIGGSGAVELE